MSVHGTSKLENKNWKFSLHAFVLLMTAFDFEPGFSIIALYSVAFDSDKTFLLISFRNHDLVSLNLSNFYFPISSFKP